MRTSLFATLLYQPGNKDCEMLYLTIALTGSKATLPLQEATGACSHHSICRDCAIIPHKVFPYLQGQVRMRHLKKPALATTLGATLQFLQIYSRKQLEELSRLLRNMQLEAQMAGIMIKNFQIRRFIGTGYFFTACRKFFQKKRGKFL